MSEYSWEICGMDYHVAHDCEADRAAREGFKGVEERQRLEALHIRNASAHMAQLCPEGMRVRTRIVVDFVPAVNARMYDHVREATAGDMVLD